MKEQPAVFLGCKRGAFLLGLIHERAASCFSWMLRYLQGFYVLIIASQGMNDGLAEVMAKYAPNSIHVPPFNHPDIIAGWAL